MLHGPSLIVVGKMLERWNKIKLGELLSEECLKN